MMDFWYDRWCFHEPLASMMGVDNPLHYFLAEFYMEQGWDVQRLQRLLPINLVQSISQLQLKADEDVHMV